MTRMPLYPQELDPTTCHRLVQGLHDLHVEDRLAVALLPAAALPAGHPLSDRVDHVGAVAVDQQVLGEVGRLLQEVENGGQLGLVVRPVRPSTGRPAALVDVPPPTGRTGVAE